jgi:hypothetical protein
MATKSEEASGTVNTKNITHQHIVVYNNSVGCKIGTKSMGQSMDGVVFKDVDVVKAGRAMTIEAYDTAVVNLVDGLELGRSDEDMRFVVRFVA